MILLKQSYRSKQSSKTFSCAIFILLSTLQVFLIGFGHNSWYRWDHTWVASLHYFWLIAWLLHMKCQEHISQVYYLGLILLFLLKVLISCYSFRSEVVARTSKIMQMASFWHDIVETVFQIFILYYFHFAKHFPSVQDWFWSQASWYSSCYNSCCYSSWYNRWYKWNHIWLALSVV